MICDLLNPLIGKSGSISMVTSRGGHIGSAATENKKLTGVVVCSDGLVCLERETGWTVIDPGEVVAVAWNGETVHPVQASAGQPRRLAKVFRSFRRPQGIVLLGAILLLCCIPPWVVTHELPSSRNSCPSHAICPDATTLIGTLIVVYTFFIAAYGALVPALIGRKCNPLLKIAALSLMIATAGLDLVRVWNSTVDLHDTTLRYLTKGDVNDAATEFTVYLAVNVGVLIFAFVVLCFPERRKTPSTALQAS
jgi:hypothetical protein